MGAAIVVALFLVFLAAALLLLAFPEFRDGCEFPPGARERSRLDSQMSLWPAGANCHLTGPDGMTREYFDGPGPWLKWTQLGIVIAALSLLIVGLFSERDARRGSAAR